MAVDIEQVQALEELLLATFPPLESEEMGGLFLGASEGVTGRANSAVVLGALDRPPTTTVDLVRDWYKARDLTPLFRLSPLASPELRSVIDGLGQPSFSPTLAMTVELGKAQRRDLREAVVLSPNAPSDEGSVSERDALQREVIARMLTGGSGQVMWAHISDGDATCAIGRGVRIDGWLSVQAMFVAEDRRGQGLAGQVLEALHRWAAEHGATDAFLNVTTGNRAAQSTYRRFGYEPVYEYVYQEVGQK